jgi:hypothetical protein
MSLKHQGPEGTSNVSKKAGTSEPSVSNLASDKEISEEGVSTSFYTDGPELNDNIPLLGALLHRHGKVFDGELTTTDQPQCRICLDVGGINIVTFENILDKINELLEVKMHPKCMAVPSTNMILSTFGYSGIFTVEQMSNHFSS